MNCEHCGAMLRAEANFCFNCGTARAGATPLRPAPDAALVPGEAFSLAGRPVRWSLRDVVIGILWFLGLFLLFPLPFAVPVAIAYGSDSDAYLAWGLILGAGSEVGLIAVAAAYTFKRYGGSWEQLGVMVPRKWSVLWWGIAAFIGAYILATAYGILIEVLDINALKGECDDQIPEQIFDNNGLLALTGIVVIAFAPVCEEIFFRGFVFPGFARTWGVAAAIIASAAAFSLGHIGPAIHKTLVPIFVIALVFAYAYYRSGNIFSTIIAHLIFNTISFAALTTCDPDDASLVGDLKAALAGVMA